MSEAPRLPTAVEIANAVVLSFAALASSWAVYQAELWDGEQAAHYAQANTLRTQASRIAVEGDTLAAVEAQLFNAWLTAKANGDEALASFYQARFPEHMKPAFNAWLAQRPLINPSAAPTPFATREYQFPGRRSASQLDARADQNFRAGQRDNAISDAFQQSATLLAVALFFGGIGQVFKLPSARIGLLAVATIALVAGILRLISLPVQVLGLATPG